VRCPEDVPKMAGFSSGGFGASSGHLIEEEAGEKAQKKTEPQGIPSQETD